MRTPFRYGNRLFSLAGQLLIFPALKDFIADVFGYGWDRNRAIDSKGNHNNALMGGYLLAASNTVISIAGILTTDTIKALTKDGLVGTVAANGTISFSTGLKYGAFEVYRGITRIGRYCLTERQGLQIINQVTGGLPNGLLGGTTTTVWQKSNAFYSETNERGYSISGTGWVTSAGVALTDGTIIPADPTNPTKCLAWVGGVQQDLQFVGRAKNSLSIVPIAFYCNGDRHWVANTWGGSVSEYTLDIYCVPIAPTESYGAIYATTTTGASADRSIMVASVDKTVRFYYPGGGAGLYNGSPIDYGDPIHININYANSVIINTITNLKTGRKYLSQANVASQLVFASAQSNIGRRSSGNYKYRGHIVSIREAAGGVTIGNYTNCQHTSNIYNTVDKSVLAINGLSTNLLQNVDLIYNTFNQTGYELWYNGTDYLIYPLASDGTTIIAPIGYTSQGIITSGNMPSIADSRMSTFKYALANSYALRQSVPEAYDTADPCAPKLLTYPELSALSANPKVIKTEADGKITNIKIK